MSCKERDLGKMDEGELRLAFLFHANRQREVLFNLEGYVDNWFEIAKAEDEIMKQIHLVGRKFNRSFFGELAASLKANE